MLSKREIVAIVVGAFVLLTGLAVRAQAQKPWFDGFRPIVVLDPGHGGNDIGAAGPEGAEEKTVSLNFARILAAELGRKYKAVLTRNDDTTLDLENRTALANHQKGNIFVSVHCGGSTIRSTSGIIIYTYRDLPGDPLTRSEVFPAPARQPESPLLWTQVQNRFRENSLELADRIKIGLEQGVGLKNIRLQGAPLLVLQGANMPAVLVEIGYLSNPGDEKKLTDQRYLIDLARAIRQGIDAYFENEE